MLIIINSLKKYIYLVELCLPFVINSCKWHVSYSHLLFSYCLIFFIRNLRNIVYAPSGIEYVLYIRDIPDKSEG